MTKVKIGKNLDDGGSLEIDLTTLIDTRLLIQSNSGGGKSYCIRKLLEETHGKVQQIVLDLEGEFHTLREKYDYVLIGKDGDVNINIKMAEMLARRLLELNVSAIVDLSELKHHERILFVKRFLDSMINSPKKLWHPVLVIIDEAHVLCPEKGKTESAGSVIDICTRGRKRGFGSALATQRLSKLSKDAVAELNNKLIGRTGLDIDMKRASDELGFTSKAQMMKLRELEAGEFFGFGPAISNKIIKTKIGKVKTTHPKAGSKQLVVSPPATHKIKAMLSKLGDLPKEAEEELKTKEELKNKIIELKFELRKKPKAEIDTKTIEELKSKSYIQGQDIIKRQSEKMLQRDLKEHQSYYEKQIREMEFNYKKRILVLSKILKGLKKGLMEVTTRSSNLYTMIKEEDFKIPEFTLEKRAIPKPAHIPIKRISMDIPKPEPQQRVDVPQEFKETFDYGEEKITGGALRMLKASAMFYPNHISKARMGTIAGLSYKSGSFGTYLATLKRNGFIEGYGNEYTITEEGMKKAGDVKPLPTDSESLVEMWANILKGGASRMLKELALAHPESLSKEELGSRAEISPTSGTFGTYLATLKRNGLIIVNKEEVKASKELFE